MMGGLPMKLLERGRLWSLCYKLRLAAFYQRAHGSSQPTFLLDGNKCSRLWKGRDQASIGDIWHLSLKSFHVCPVCLTDLSISQLVEKEVENERTTKQYPSLFSVPDLIFNLFSFSFSHCPSLTYIHTLTQMCTHRTHSHTDAHTLIKIYIF